MIIAFLIILLFFDNLVLFLNYVYLHAYQYVQVSIGSYTDQNEASDPGVICSYQLPHVLPVLLKG